ncbi:hypothetical protein [Shewanella fidelis]|uniref:DUF4178 domain-containing protein n=1 Tax=Shewanella fidelis TaxID=173509 RepID=A0AAW8NLS3_9GAMM|nr:hypothetical protein [Shewanella fidelis]MDR8522873.1 hypothetical protein [Shewanella fidelis]MDW4811801.1 hypothetical protein [Shewanella fidelis]MDW4815922.1 hypothetical protein [Shewanella fidelis]MDW4820012.1 hypothetical protein [Shewanella fidelis]MDW4824014.1 hypothetical protein [Shewanella fidelis]
MKGTSLKELYSLVFTPPFGNSFVIEVVALTSDNCWYEIVVSDGESSINSTFNSPIKSRKLDESLYSWQAMEGEEWDELGELVSIKEYLYNEKLDESRGFLFTFENGCLNILEQDDGILATTDSIIDNECILKELS